MKNKLSIAVICLGAASVLFVSACGRSQNGEIIPQTTDEISVESVGEEGFLETRETETAGALSEETQMYDSENTLATETMDTSEETDTTNDSPNVSEETTIPESPTDGKPVGGTMTYEKYNAMSGAEQQAFFESFADPQDFFAWYNAAKAEYEKNNQDIIIDGDGEIDLEDIIGGNNP